MLLYPYPVIYRAFQKDSAMSEVTLNNFQLQLSLMVHQETTRENNSFIPDKQNDVNILS